MHKINFHLQLFLLCFIQHKNLHCLHISDLWFIPYHSLSIQAWRISTINNYKKYMPREFSYKFSKQVCENFIFLQQLMTRTIYKILVPDVNWDNISKNIVLYPFSNLISSLILWPLRLTESIQVKTNSYFL